jgi:hypothetical protein
MMYNSPEESSSQLHVFYQVDKAILFTNQYTEVIKFLIQGPDYVLKYEPKSSILSTLGGNLLKWFQICRGCVKKFYPIL